jgi:hypothetical protein
MGSIAKELNSNQVLVFSCGIFPPCLAQRLKEKKLQKEEFNKKLAANYDQLSHSPHFQRAFLTA